MQVFTTDRKTYRANELKSWAWEIVFVSVLYFGFKLIFLIPQETLFVGVAIIFLLKIGDTLTQYHVKTIQLDKENDQLNLILSSIMTGQKNKSYGLQQINSGLIENKSWANGFKSSPTLKIYATEKEVFQINSRYGFTKDVLIAINNAVSLSNHPGGIQ